MSNLKTSFPQSDSIAKIADYLGCSVDYLLGRTDDPKGINSNMDPEMAEAIKLFANLPSDKREELLNFIRTFSK